ncbi:nitrilase-related carbon-nitrogen hydrolase [Pseudonocardia nigra]|uniref:nitrilase-related carbon-nitrogen hydrolase n=1 Tax=Pseudonocardia nigra TaxID=1921578 RepID=UPI001C5D01A2|nr:nitrilase-related carbon-nitrogen hydrolase [Pseudonocardia nigra]
MRIALAQVDCALGDPEANLGRATGHVQAAADQQADLVVFPELALHGYALGQVGEDRSIPANDVRLLKLSESGTDVVMGFHEDGGSRTYNAAAYLSAGSVLHLHRKLYLPTYLMWEERKHVSPGQALRAYDTRFGRLATLVCNDAWQPVVPWLATQDGAELLLVVANSATAADPGRTEPQSLDTVHYWEQLLSYTARMQQCWVVFVNRVGTEAGVRFWGGSRVLDPTGDVVAEAPMWEESLTVVDVDVRQARRRQRAVPLVGEARLGMIGREIERLIQQGGDA